MTTIADALACLGPVPSNSEASSEQVVSEQVVSEQVASKLTTSKNKASDVEKRCAEHLMMYIMAANRDATLSTSAAGFVNDAASCSETLESYKIAVKNNIPRKMRMKPFTSITTGAKQILASLALKIADEFNNVDATTMSTTNLTNLVSACGAKSAVNAWWAKRTTVYGPELTACEPINNYFVALFDQLITTPFAVPGGAPCLAANVFSAILKAVGSGMCYQLWFHHGTTNADAVSTHLANYGIDCGDVWKFRADIRPSAARASKAKTTESSEPTLCMAEIDAALGLTGAPKAEPTGVDSTEAAPLPMPLPMPMPAPVADFHELTDLQSMMLKVTPSFSHATVNDFIDQAIAG